MSDNVAHSGHFSYRTNIHVGGKSEVREFCTKDGTAWPCDAALAEREIATLRADLAHCERAWKDAEKELPRLRAIEAAAPLPVVSAAIEWWDEVRPVRGRETDMDALMVAAANMALVLRALRAALEADH